MEDVPLWGGGGLAGWSWRAHGPLGCHWGEAGPRGPKDRGEQTREHRDSEDSVA